MATVGRLQRLSDQANLPALPLRGRRRHAVRAVFRTPARPCAFHLLTELALGGPSLVSHASCGLLSEVSKVEARLTTVDRLHRRSSFRDERQPRGL